MYKIEPSNSTLALYFVLSREIFLDVEIFEEFVTGGTVSEGQGSECYRKKSAGRGSRVPPTKNEDNAISEVEGFDLKVC